MLQSPQIERLIDLAIDEDLGCGDITTDLVVPTKLTSQAELIAKEGLVLCGTPLIERVFARLRFDVEVKILKQEGEQVKSNECFAICKGKVVHLLSAERIILNFLQRLSGIASYTRKIQHRARPLTILDTRKTTPGWRILEKYAVKIGGAKNHRFNLGDMILVKNNHIDARAGNISEILRDLHDRKPYFMPIQVEVRDFEELKAAIAGKPDAVMLDNMRDAEIKRSMQYVKQHTPTLKVEISGQITEKRFATLRKLGVSCVSMGALTKSAPSVDISMRIKRAR